MPDLTWFHRDTRFQAGDWRCSARDTAPHAIEVSRRPAIAFTRRGVYRRHVGGRSLLVDASTVVLYPQWLEYRVSHPLMNGDRSMVVSLTDRALEIFGIQRLTSDHAAASARTAVRLREVERAAREGARLAVEELLVHLVSETLISLSGDRPPAGRPHAVAGRPGTAAAHRRAVEHAREVMATRCAERLTLDDIARGSGYSVPHLCEIFREATGFTIHRYLSRLRLMLALEGLEGPLSLSRLAYEVGFSSPSHFSTAFRREFGEPPSRLLPALRRKDVVRLGS